DFPQRFQQWWLLFFLKVWYRVLERPVQTRDRESDSSKRSKAGPGLLVKDASYGALTCYARGMERQHLIAHNKLDYVHGKRPDVPCILCAVRDHHPEVDQLEVYRTSDFLVSLNLYPYNPG